MFSIEKMAKRILVGTIIFILFALVVNFNFLPVTKALLNNSNNDISDIKSQAVSIELPIRVLENILTQIEADSSKLENVNLLEAYDSNLKTLQAVSSNITDKIIRLENDLDKLNQYSFSLYKAIINELKAVINNLNMINNELYEVSVSSQLRNTDIDTIKLNGNQLIAYVETLEKLSHSLNDDVLSVYTWMVNIIFLIMVILLLFLGFGIYKIVTYDQAFVIESFKHMENKSYDFESLPKSRLIFEEERIIHDTVKHIFEEEKLAQRIKNVIISSYHIDDVMQLLFKELSINNPLDRIGIAFVDYSRQKFVAEYGTASYDNIKLGPGFEVDLKKTSLSNIIKTKASFITLDLEAEHKKRPKSAALTLLRAEGIQSNLVVPLLMGEAVFGAIFFSSTQKNYFDERSMRRAEKIINEISGFLNRAYFTKVILSKITNSFSELVDKKDNETGGHILRMVAYSVLIAKGLMKKNIPGYEVNQKFILEIERNASSHDIGKVGIPDEILKKPGKLTPDEWEIMRAHANIGADIFKSLREGLQVFGSDFYEHAEAIARYHHERFDGTGYPEGLSGQDIPLAARIVAVADVFDALSSKRHYKDAFGLEKSLEIIQSSAGSHLDPVIVETFIEHIDEIKYIQNQSNSNEI